LEDTIWSEVREFVIDESSGQMLEISVWSREAGNETRLASYDLECDVIKRRRCHEDFFKAAKGCFHLRLLWIDLTTNPQQKRTYPRFERLAESNTIPHAVVKKVCRQVCIEDKCAIGFLMVHLYSASLKAPRNAGGCHDSADAEWIVIRGLLRGHNDMSCGQPTSGWPISHLGVGHR
jgi:hypothetical protein